MRNLSSQQVTQLNILKASISVVNVASELLEITKDLKRQDQLIDMINANIHDSLSAIIKVKKLQIHENPISDPVYDLLKNSFNL